VCQFWLILSIKYYSSYSCLNYHFSTDCTRKCGYIYCASLCSFNPCKHNCIFFCMNTKTFIKLCSLTSCWVAAWTSSFITIWYSTRSPIVPLSNYFLWAVYNQCSYTTFYAIWSRRNNYSNSHKISIPIRSNKSFIIKLKLWNYLLQVIFSLTIIKMLDVLEFRENKEIIESNKFIKGNCLIFLIKSFKSGHHWGICFVNMKVKPIS